MKRKKKKIDESANNPEKSSTTEIGEHLPCEYSMSSIWAFDLIEGKHILYRGEDCMKKCYSSLGEHATIKLNFEKNKMLPLKREELKLHQGVTNCYICGKGIL